MLCLFAGSNDNDNDNVNDIDDDGYERTQVNIRSSRYPFIAGTLSCRGPN